MDNFEPFDHDLGGPELVERPQKKKWLLIGGAVGLALIAVVIAVAVLYGPLLRAKASPEQTIKRGYANTTEAMQKQWEDSPWQMWHCMAEALRSGSFKVSFSCGDDWSHGSGDVWLRSDWEEAAFALGMDIESDGIPVDGELYFDRERAALSSSILPDCYGITFASFEEDLRASALPEVFDLSEDDIQELVEVFDQLNKALEDVDLKNIPDTYKKSLEDLITGLDFQTSQGKQSIGGKELSCIILSTQIKEDDIKEFAAAISDLYFGSASALAKYSYEFAELDDMRDMVEDAIVAVYKGADLTWYFYHDKLVKVEFSNDMKLYGTAFHLDFDMDMGAEPGKDSWTFDLNAKPIGEDPLKLSLTYLPNEGGAVYSDRLEGKLTVDGETTKFTLATDWDRESGELTIALEVPPERLTLEGRLELDGNGRCVLQFEDLGQQFSELADEGEGFDLDLTLTAEKGNGPSCPAFVNLDRWNQKVLEEIAQAVAAYEYNYITG